MSARGGGRPSATIEQVVGRIPEWAGRRVAVRPVPDALTNTCYRVEVDGAAYAVRIPGAGSDLLGIDRERELRHARLAAQRGLGPRVVHYLADLGVLVTAWVPGAAMTAEALRRPGMPGRVGAMLRQLHAGPRFGWEFDLFRLMDDYQAVVARRGLPLPDTFRARLPALRRIRTALEARRPPRVPCHNDLYPANLVDDGARLWLLDWEYSGDNDPAFDLGNACTELGYGEGQIRELCAAYDGRVDDGRLARIRLHMIVADAGWTLWAAIQAAVARQAFDFWGYGLERWRRAEAPLDAPELPDWLEAVGRPP